MSITGGCLCGACRYSSDGEAMNVRACHCTRCQQATGSAFYARVMVPSAGVTITGPVSWYDAGTGVRRGFCTVCGSTLFTERASVAGIGLALGTLDNRARFAPSEHIFVADKQPWLVLADGLPQHDGVS